MKELGEKLREASRAYYQEDREIMSNVEYDALYDTLPQTRIFCSALCWYGEKAVTADSTV